MTADEEGVLVRYPYVVSLVFVTLRYESRVHRVATADGRYLRGVPYLLVTLVLGWWGLPWGPLLAARAIWDCLDGGVEQPA